MNYNDAMDYLFLDEHMTPKKRSLSRITNLMAEFGNPQNELKFVHIAGTNGKGSTSSMLSSVLHEAGYKTGLFTSPSLKTYNERISVNGKMISDEDFAKLLTRVSEKIDILKEKNLEVPSHFEIIAACAFLYYYDMKCDIVVLEVGLGGEFDATNVIENTDVCVITPISYDHMHILGNTIEEIAKAKAGIIKNNSSVVYAPQEEGAKDIILERAKEKNAVVRKSEHSEINLIKSEIHGQIFDYKKYKNVEIKLIGLYQIQNASLVLETVDALRERGFKISESAVYSGLKNAKWAGRFEVVSENPVIILDGAHNPHGVNSLYESLVNYFKDKKIIFMIGILEDKNYQEMIDIVSPIAKKVVTVTPHSHRAIQATVLKEYIESKGIDVVSAIDIGPGLDIILKNSNKDDVICIFGSLYFLADVREFFNID